MLLRGLNNNYCGEGVTPAAQTKRSQVKFHYCGKCEQTINFEFIETHLCVKKSGKAKYNELFDMGKEGLIVAPSIST